MVGECRIAPLYGRFVEIGFCDGRLQVVDLDRLGDAAKVAERVDVAMYEGRDALVQYSGSVVKTIFF